MKGLDIVVQCPFLRQVQTGSQIRDVAKGLIQHHINGHQIQENQETGNYVNSPSHFLVWSVNPGHLYLTAFFCFHQYSTSLLLRYWLMGTATINMMTNSAIPTATEYPAFSSLKYRREI